MAKPVTVYAWIWFGKLGFCLKENVLTSGPQSCSKRPALASKQEAYRMVSSRSWNLRNRVIYRTEWVKMNTMFAVAGIDSAHIPRIARTGKSCCLLSLDHKVYRVPCRLSFRLSELGPPPESVAPSPLGPGRRHTRLRGRGWGHPIPTMGQTLRYSMYIIIDLRVRLKGTQGWEFFWLRFWILYYCS
jgi:hypothetical protein